MRLIALFVLLLLPLAASRSSWSQMPPGGPPSPTDRVPTDAAPPGFHATGDPVELRGGNLEWNQTDLTTGGPLPLAC